jgi:hypothetical protein
MPAPERPKPSQSFTTSVAVPKGIVGYYTDAEIDRLLEALEVGGGVGGVVDLSNYYTKPEVDATLTSITAQILDAGDLSLVNSQVQALATVTQDALTGLEAKADKTTVSTLGTTLMNSIIEVKDGTYSKAEVDAALANVATGGTIDLGGYATTEALDAVRTEIVTGATAAFMERYTKQEVDALFVKQADMVAPPSFDGYATEQYVDDSIARIPAVDLSGYFTKAESDARYVPVASLTAETLAAAIAGQDLSQGNVSANSVEVNGLFIGADGDRLVTQTNGGTENKVAYMADLSGYAPTSTTTLISTQMQALFDSIYTRPEADDRYAAKQNNAQQLLAKTVVAQAVGFGDSAQPPVALTYTDTGEGYGPRLVFAVGMVNDYVALRSDFDPIVGRMDALESKVAQVADLSAYAQKPEVDYVSKKVDAVITEVGLMADKITTMALQANPTSAPSINDPALAAFKKSVLDEVKLMLAGGTKMPPADIDWTPIIRMEGARETTSTQIEARMLGGFIELKGTLAFNAGSGDWVPLRLPPQFPMAEIEAKYPLAMRLVGSAVTYGYCTVSNKNRDISVSPGARSSEAAFSGIRWKAAY